MIDKGWVNIYINYYAELYTFKGKCIFMNFNQIVEWIGLDYQIYCFTFSMCRDYLPSKFVFHQYLQF
jgi:hypothetical protein